MSERIGRMRLRGRILAACVALGCAPALIAWALGLFDQIEQRRVRGELRKASEALLAHELTRARGLSGDLEWLHGFARDHDVLIRVLDERGRVLKATDARFGLGRSAQRWWLERTSDFFFGPAGPPDLIGFELSLGPEHERPEVITALAGGIGESMRVPAIPHMQVFYRAAPVGDRVAYLTRASPRNLRRLFDDRYQLLQLSSALSVGAVIMGLWLGWTFVAPLRRLEHLIARHLRIGRTETIALARNDEIGVLSRHVEELAARLERRAIDTANLAADLAHDLKNPITAIRASGELLASSASIEGERRDRIARAIERSVERLERSVDALLELARLDAEMMLEPRVALDLRALVDSVVDGYRARPNLSHLTFETHGPSAWVLGSRARLETMLMNLIDNAVVFASSRIAVSIVTRESMVEAEERVRLDAGGDVANVGRDAGRGLAKVANAANSANSANDETGANGASGAFHAGSRAVSLFVEDDGPGVLEANRAKVFQRFFSKRPDHSEGGSGLGLPIVAAIARAHGATLELSSTAGPHRLAGACFVVSWTTAAACASVISGGRDVTFG